MLRFVLGKWYVPVVVFAIVVSPGFAQTESGHKSLEELLNASGPKEISPSQETQTQWRRMVNAFAQNDEKTGLTEAEIMETHPNLLTPQQVQMLGLFMQLGKMQPGDTPPDSEIDRLKLEASKALAEAESLQRDFDKFKAQADQLPKPFSYGSTTHVKMVELNNAAVAAREKKEKVMKTYEELRKKYEERRPIVIKILETQISSLVDGSEARGEIEDALAVCNTYLRKNNSASQIAARGESLAALQKKEAHARELVAAVESSTRPLLAQHKLSAAEKAMTGAVLQIQARLSDQAEKPMVLRLLKPLDKEMQDALREGSAKEAAAHKAAAEDLAHAGDRLAELTTFWQDCPDLEGIKAEIDQSKLAKENRAYDARLSAIAETLKNDPASAKELLRNFEKSLKPDDALLLQARLSTAWRDAWEVELAQIRTDMNEAHSFLTKIRADFSYLLEHGDKAAIHEAVHASGSVENLTRARSLLQGALSRVNLALADMQDPVLRTRAIGLRQSLQSSLDLLADADAEAKSKAAGPLNPLMLIGSTAAGMLLLSGVITFTLKRKKRAATV